MATTEVGSPDVACTVPAARRGLRRRGSRAAPAVLLLAAAAAAQTAWSAESVWVAPARRGHGLVAMRATSTSFEGKVAAKLGPYKAGAITAKDIPSPEVDAKIIDAALVKKKATTTKFERINFTGSGAKLGHTVVIEMEAKRGEGHPQRGAPIPGTKMKGYQLELKESQPDPWRQFVAAIIKAGMGQMESKTFPVSFPADYKKADFAGTTVDFTVLVLEIGELRPVAPDARPEAEQRAELEAELRQQAQLRTHTAIDVQIRAALLESSEVDTDAKTKSVSWAKFGDESEKSLKWTCILEEVSRNEGVPFDKVQDFLREQAIVQYAAR
mmetsp:Transcript_33275/g.95757  ORF Transcript_33275/g.95757 Transcript_33275/m.95757 type:complete len:327 (-) Transcript_33275:208-1188(-)|eukprot:CAMPEP_0177192040 /NCGR_PEP_ID=MMETSP0367-20130122/21680_1 /TAXON_ID=447022 ORGANISM="Scrippsiella hangoei-like, Strain SHHI-4" /NCGR_SAMPLE_ID=MMETSP0367 /ASSEMBLY_ACC=CAM_ASM_000362 /LENGTH=326 /DNA_ID=CAMNT_0018639799 /DNA_START=99 /DNA_END=1079 /DNA_ORIENTATION=-